MRPTLAALAAAALGLAALPAAAGTLEIRYQLGGGTFVTPLGLGSQAVISGSAVLRMEAAGSNAVSAGAQASLLQLTATGPTDRIQLVNPHPGFMSFYGPLAFFFRPGVANAFRIGPALSQSLGVAFSDSYFLSVLGGAPHFQFTAEPGPVTAGVIGRMTGTEVSRTFVSEPRAAQLALASLGALGLAAAAARRASLPA